MCPRILATFLGAAGLLCYATTVTVAADAESPALPAPQNVQVEAHVKAAFEMRRLGNSSEFKSELKQALNLDPDFAPAHWQLGEVQRGDQWQSIRDIAGPDPHVLAEYNELRNASLQQPVQLVLNANASPPRSPRYYSAVNEDEGPSVRSTRLRIEQPTALYARRQFELKERPVSAMLRIRPIGDITVLVNGQVVCHPKSKVAEVQANVVNRLVPGVNVIAVEGVDRHDDSPCGLSLRMEVISPDKSVQTVVTDDQWRTARQAPADWAKRKFDDSQWGHLTPTTRNDVILVPHPKLKKLDNGEIDHQHPVDLQNQSTMQPSLQTEVTLAEWSTAHGLSERARQHWENVLQIDPQNPLALEALGLVHFGPRLVSKAHLERIKRQSEEEKRQEEAAAERISKLCTDYESQDTERAQSAADTMGTLDESHLDAFLNLTKVNSSGPARHEHFALAFIKEQLPHWRSSRATQALVSVTCDQASEALRSAAIDVLRNRPWENFVPHALNRLSNPVVVNIDTETHNSNEIIVRGYMRQENRFEEYEFFNEQRFLITHANAEYRVRMSRLGANAPAFFAAVRQDAARGESARLRTVANATQAAETVRKKLEKIATERSDKINTVNARVTSLLNSVSQQDLPVGVDNWWDWWTEYNSLDTTPFVKPVYRMQSSQSTPLQYQGPSHITKCCFAGNTPVWTETGLRPIASIKAGDWVWAQHSVTGELTMKPVTAVVSRADTETQVLNLGNERITTTLGHRFWKYGTGWVMSKRLKAGDRLHTLESSCQLQSISAGPAVEAYNLIVDDFHSYFVGRSGLYAHDNELPEIPDNPVPGLIGASAN